MAEQTERSFLKEPNVFLSTKASAKGKQLGKADSRFWKNVGLGFKTPQEAIEGTYIDKKFPFTGNVAIRGRILMGPMFCTMMTRTVVVRRDYLHFVPKYQRYEKQHSNLSAHVSPAFRVKEGESDHRPVQTDTVINPVLGRLQLYRDAWPQLWRR